jgi:hypothetical protein
MMTDELEDMMAYDIKAIIAAGQLAIDAAFAADEGEDGGTYNLDFIEMLFPTMSRNAGMEVCNALWRHGKDQVSVMLGGGGYSLTSVSLSFSDGGCGNRNKRMTVAALQKLKDARLDASIVPRPLPADEPHGNVRRDGQMLSRNPPMPPISLDAKRPKKHKKAMASEAAALKGKAVE